MNKVLAGGSRDEFGERLKQKQKNTSLISNVLNEKGFMPINTPFIEKESTFEQYRDQNIFHLYDQAGDNLILRPDLTLPVARFLSSHQQENDMSQLYYIGDVFRRTDYLSGEYNQETQAGIELIGDDSFEAEIQALDIMLNFAKKFNITDVQVVLSDARLIDIILDTLQLDGELHRALKRAIEQKNVSEFEKLRAEIVDFPEFLNEWPLSYGEDGENVMWQLQHMTAVATITQGWLRVANHAHQYYPNVKVTVDLAAASPQPYYTGTIIRGFIPTLGRYLFSGGRYDRLLENFQKKLLPAVGIGLNIETIQADWEQSAYDLTTRQPIVMVLGKGRVEKDVRPLLKAAGIDTTPLDNPERKLIFDTADGRYRFILVKPNDVVKYLDRGIGDVGIVGSDTIAEQRQSHYDVLDLKTGRAQFVVAAPADFHLNLQRRQRIATKYPKVATKYFTDRGEDVALIKLEGSVELGPLTGLADAIIDITQTGNTLRENHLQVHDIVGEVSTHMLVRAGALLRYQTELTQVIQNLTKLLKEATNK